MHNRKSGSPYAKGLCGLEEAYFETIFNNFESKIFQILAPQKL